MKWGVGRVVYETTMQGENTKCAFEEGINNGKLIVLPMYHLNMEQILPEAEDLKVISPIPGKKKEVYCMFGKPIDFSDVLEGSKEKLASCKTQEERDKMMYVIYEELTCRVEKALESLEYELKAVRKWDQNSFVCFRHKSRLLSSWATANTIRFLYPFCPFPHPVVSRIGSMPTCKAYVADASQKWLGTVSLTVLWLIHRSPTISTVLLIWIGSLCTFITKEMLIFPCTCSSYLNKA